MELTDQMNGEWISIKNRLNKINKLTQGSRNPIIPELKKRLETELNTHKLKLEHLLSETDHTNEKCDLLSTLLMLESIYCSLYVSVGPWGEEVRTFSEDYARYVEMGMHMAPDNIGFNFRYD